MKTNDDFQLIFIQNAKHVYSEHTRDFATTYPYWSDTPNSQTKDAVAFWARLSLSVTKKLAPYTTMLRKAY